MGERLFFSKLITKDLTAVDSSRRLFEGVLTVEMKDRQGEITIRDELLKVLPIWIARGGPITDTHSNRVVGKGINYAATTVTDAEGKTYPAITIQGEIFRDYELDNEIWKAIKSGKYKGLSFGGATKSGRSPILEKDGSVAYSLKDLEQYEVAVCEEPAVPLALITQHNEIAKAMAGNTTDRGEGKMCIRCDKFKCFVEKDSLIKIEDDEDDNTQVTVLDEWKNETHPDKNGKTEGIRTTKNSEPYSDVTGSNKPEGRDEQAEALKEEREKEDELENNRGEPQENGATYHGTNKTRKHTCDAHWAEQKHIHTDSPNTIETCVHVDNAEGMGGKVKSEGGAVSTGTEGANNPVNSGKPDKKTIPRIIREFEDEGHGDPFDDKAMDKDDKEMLERADLEEEKKLEHAHDEPDGPERTKADPPEKQSFEGKNQINAGEKHSQEGKNYDREINPGMPGNSPEKVDKIAPLIAAAGGALARGAAGAGRVIGRGAKQVGQEVGADLGIDDDESQLQKATLDILRLTWETKTQKKTTSLVKGDPSSFGDDDYTPYEGKGPGDKKFVRPEKEDEKTPKKEQMPRWMRRQRKAPEVIENKRSRFHSNTNVSHGDLPRPQRDPPPVNQSGKTSKETQDKKIQSSRRRQFPIDLDKLEAAISGKKKKKVIKAYLDLLNISFQMKSETPSNVWSEPARGGFAGREHSHKDEEQEEDEDNNTRSIHDVNQPKHVNKPVEEEGAEGVKKAKIKPINYRSRFTPDKELTTMNPKTYLDMTPGHGGRKRTNLDDAHSNTSHDGIPNPRGDHHRGDELGSVEHYKREMRHGKDVEAPGLYGDKGKVNSHEGRHRARAAMEEGNNIKTEIADSFFSTRPGRKRSRSEVSNMRGQDESGKEYGVASGKDTRNPIMSKKTHQVKKYTEDTSRDLNSCSNLRADMIDGMKHNTEGQKRMSKKDRKEATNIRETLGVLTGKIPKPRQFKDQEKLKFDNAMEANNSEDGKNGKMRTNNDEESEAFKGEKTTTIKEKRPTQVIHHLATNKFDTTTRPMGSDGERGSGAYNTAMQGHGLQMDPRRVKDEKCNSCGEDSDNGGDNPQYEK